MQYWYFKAFLSPTQICRHYDENLLWVVDKFHIKGHIVSGFTIILKLFILLFYQERKCMLSDELCVYHPDLPKNKPLFEGVNLEVFFIIKFKYSNLTFLDM